MKNVFPISVSPKLICWTKHHYDYLHFDANQIINNSIC